MFVVCGEALMDVYLGDSPLTGMRLDACIGGSPLNVAGANWSRTWSRWRTWSR